MLVVSPLPQEGAVQWAGEALWEEATALCCGFHARAGLQGTAESSQHLQHSYPWSTVLLCSREASSLLSLCWRFGFSTELLLALSEAEVWSRQAVFGNSPISNGWAA